VKVGEIQQTTSRGNPFTGSFKTGHVKIPKGRKARKAALDRAKNFNLKTAFARFYGSGDVGGPFASQRSRIIPDGRFFNLKGASGITSETYDGFLDAVSVSTSAIDYPTFSSQSVMNSLGTRAIGVMLPTNPLSNMGQFLGELSDLPRIPDIRKWKKIISEVHHATKHIDLISLVVKGLMNISMPLLDGLRLLLIFRSLRESFRTIRRKLRSIAPVQIIYCVDALTFHW
jgi:hypothetical protein